MSGSDSPRAQPPAYTFGSAPHDTSSSTSGSGSGSAAGEFTFSAPLESSTSGVGSGYLDDAHAGGSRSSGSRLDATSLFATLAQRQMTQAQYDDDAAWTTSHPRRHRPHHRRGSIEDDLSSSSSSGGGGGKRRERRRRDSLSSAGSYSTTSSAHERALQREWDEQLDQLKLMFQIIILPFVGKFFGRKFGYFCKSNTTTAIDNSSSFSFCRRSISGFAALCRRSVSWEESHADMQFRFGGQQCMIGIKCSGRRCGARFGAASVPLRERRILKQCNGKPKQPLTQTSHNFTWPQKQQRPPVCSATARSL